jgi:folate-binding protein YgfZ
MSEATIKTRAPAGYQVALEASAYYRLPAPGYVLLGGATRPDYLQRQTSNDMGLLSAQRALSNALTAPTGRIMEYFNCAQIGDGIALLTPEDHGPGLATYFAKRVFFNDQVTIEDQSADWAQFELHGPQAGAILEALGFSAQPGLDAVAAIEWQDQPLTAIGIRGLGAEIGWRLLLPAGAAENLIATLDQAGAAVLSTEAANVLRIEAARPGPGELNGDYTPFEVGLDHIVSATKGCYTGQEVLARQVTYDKITRQIALLACEPLAEPGTGVVHDGKRAGAISSVALSPRLGPIALAVLRKPAHEPGTQLELDSPVGKHAEVISPP